MRTNTRRLSKVVAIGALTAMGLTLAACQASGGDTETKSITVLSSWVKGDPTGDVFRAQAAAFTKETGIDVVINDVANEDFLTTFEADYLAGKEADVLVENVVGDNQRWVTDGLVEDVAPLIKDWGYTDRIQDGALAVYTNADGQVSGFPYQGFVWPVWYNKAIFEQAGVDIPTTFDELVTASAAIRAIGKQPFAVGGSEWTGLNWMEWITSQYLTSDEVTDLVTGGQFCSNPKFMKGLDLLSQMLSDGVFADNVAGYSNDAAQAAFFNGDVAMFPSGSWILPSVTDDQAANIVLAGFPVPTGAANPNPTIYQGFNQGFWVTRNGAAKEDAIHKFMDFFYNQDTVNAFVDGADFIPALTVDPNAAAPESPLLAQAVTLSSKSSAQKSWDTLLPVGVDPFPTAQAIYTGATPDQTCASLESAWKESK